MDQWVFFYSAQKGPDANFEVSFEVSIQGSVQIYSRRGDQSEDPET